MAPPFSNQKPKPFKKEDKYAVIKITSVKDKADQYELLTTDDFLEERYVEPETIPEKEDWIEYYVVDNKAAQKEEGITYKLVNTAGSIQKNKNKAKDGMDRCFKLKGEKIQDVYAE